MRTRALIALTVVFGCTWNVSAQVAAKPKVGDWVQYKQSNSFADKAGKELKVKQTISALDDKTVTLKLETTIGDKTTEGKDIQTPLDQLADPLKLFAKGKNKVEKGESGKETIKVGKEEIACDWTAYKMTLDVGGKAVENNVKVWISREVPLSGLVRMEFVFGKNTTTMELTGYGRGK